MTTSMLFQWNILWRCHIPGEYYWTFEDWHDSANVSVRNRCILHNRDPTKRDTSTLKTTTECFSNSLIKYAKCWYSRNGFYTLGSSAFFIPAGMQRTRWSFQSVETGFFIHRFFILVGFFIPFSAQRHKFCNINCIRLFNHRYPSPRQTFLQLKGSLSIYL